MTYSQYTYVEAFINEQQKAWITTHIHMYEFFDDVAKMLVSDNCRKQSIVPSKDLSMQKVYGPDKNQV